MRTLIAPLPAAAIPNCIPGTIFLQKAPFLTPAESLLFAGLKMGRASDNAGEQEVGMVRIAVDLVHERAEDVEVTCFTIPGPGVCITIRSAAASVEIDLPEAIYTLMMEKITTPERGDTTATG